ARQPVDDLALAFIAPLGADHGDVCQRIELSAGETARALGADGSKGKGAGDNRRQGDWIRRSDTLVCSRQANGGIDGSGRAPVSRLRCLGPIRRRLLTASTGRNRTRIGRAGGAFLWR